MLAFIIRVAVVVLIGYAIWRLVRPRYDLEIVIDEDGVAQCEGLPKAQTREMLEFLNELPLDGQLIIRARRQAGGYWRIDFKGSLHPSTRQRIRNFLNTVIQ